MNWYKKAQTNPNPLDGMKNEQARKFVRNLVYPLFEKPNPTFYSDESWEGIARIWKALNDANIDYIIESANYYNDNPNNPMPTSKTWKIIVSFTNDKQKPTTLKGTITAHGAGSVEQPLDKYDVTFVIF